MSKYFKSFDELKIAFTAKGDNPKEFYDLVVNDLDKAEELAKRSAFGTNPINNVILYQTKMTYLSFDDFLDLIVCKECPKRDK